MGHTVHHLPPLPSSSPPSPTHPSWTELAHGGTRHRPDALRGGGDGKLLTVRTTLWKRRERKGVGGRGGVRRDRVELTLPQITTMNADLRDYADSTQNRPPAMTTANHHQQGQEFQFLSLPPSFLPPSLMYLHHVVKLRNLLVQVSDAMSKPRPLASNLSTRSFPFLHHGIQPVCVCVCVCVCVLKNQTKITQQSRKNGILATLALPLPTTPPHMPRTWSASQQPSSQG